MPYRYKLPPLQPFLDACEANRETDGYFGREKLAHTHIGQITSNFVTPHRRYISVLLQRLLVLFIDEGEAIADRFARECADETRRLLSSAPTPANATDGTPQTLRPTAKSATAPWRTAQSSAVR